MADSTDGIVERHPPAVEPHVRQDVAPERLDELGLVAPDVVEVDLVEAHVHVVLDVRDVLVQVGRSSGRGS